MSNAEVLGMIGWLLFYAAVGIGVIAGAAMALNQLAYKIEQRLERRHSVVDRVDSYCNVYPLRRRTPTVDSVRSRRGDAA